MKSLSALLTLFILVGLFSCEPSVTFNEPQPVGKKALLEFPKSLTGEYISLTDSSTLKIQNQIIERIYDRNYKIAKSELDSNYKIVGDTLIDLTSNEKTDFVEIGDSLQIHIYNVDTLFQISDSDVLKKFKGYYFINSLYEEGRWEVRKVKSTKNQIIISSISTENEIKNLQEITEAPQDTIPPYSFKTSKKQFKEFLKQGGFAEEEIFVRVR